MHRHFSSRLVALSSFDRFYLMDEDLRRGLLTKKIGFDKMYEDGLMRVAKMRQKNDGFQRNIGPDIDEEIR